MKSQIRLFSVVFIIVLIGAVLIWKINGQNSFQNGLVSFSKGKVDRIEICETKGSNVFNCIESKQTKGIIRLISQSETSIGPSKTPHTIEVVLKLYQSDSMKCYRAVEYKGNEGNIYLKEILPNQDCSKFKFGPHSVIVKGLSKYVLSI